MDSDFLKGKVTKKDNPTPKVGRGVVKKCPNCTEGKIGKKDCIACNGQGVRRQY